MAEDLVPKGDPSLGVFIVIMLVGFVIGTAGHVIRSRALVIIGIATIFTATVILPLLIFGGDR